MWAIIATPGLPAVFADDSEEEKVWWLRSPNANSDYTQLAGVVRDAGQVNAHASNNIRAVRPAFNLNLNSVLFTSAAEGGKGRSKLLAKLEPYTGNEWKLTLKDTGRQFEVMDKSPAPGSPAIR